MNETLRRIEEQRARPPKATSGEEDTKNSRSGFIRRFLRRGPWEMVATLLIALGVIMLMQPFTMVLFTYSFVTILTGTVMFIIVSHFPE